MAYFDKYLKKALKALRWEWLDSTREPTYENLKDIHKENEEDINEAKRLIEDLKESVILLKKNKSNIETLLHQVRIEEYKDLNKGKKIEIS